MKSPYFTHITHHNFADSQDIRRTELNKSVRRLITRKEELLGAKCRRIWVAKNPLGEDIMFSKFCSNRIGTIVTLAAYIPHVGWVSSH